MAEINTYLPGIILAYTAFCLGLLSPGPNILAVIGTAMGTGRAEGKALALGISAGSLCWGVLTMFGMTALIATYASVMTAIKIAGGLYLIWLGLKALRSAAQPKPIATVKLQNGRGPGHYLRRGLLIQMTNPKAALTWIAIMSLAMDANAPVWVGAAIVVGTGILSVAGHVSYALTFSTQPIVAAYGRARRWIELALGGFFCFVGVKLLTSRT